MSVKITDIIEQHGISDKIELHNERSFDFFARATTNVDGSKCIFIADKKYIKDIDNTVSMIITDEETSKSISPGIGLCVCENPRGLFFELLSLHESNDRSKKIETEIGKNCIISETAVISPYNVKIGNNVTVGDYVVIHPNTFIGDNTTLQGGTIVGEQDFNVYDFHGKIKQAYHGGKVVIGSNTLISSNVLIGQAMYSYGKTSIGNNCFIGATTCIGHNTEIGEKCEICGNSMLGGYCKIGNNTKLFMSVTIANATSIGNNVTINMGSVVVRNIPDNKIMFGNPAREMIKPASN